MSSPHPIKPGSTPPPLPSIPRFSTRPVHPFSMSCEFDRQRGQFVVHAGARAGACAVLTAAALVIGTFGYVRSAVFHGGPSPAAAAAAVTPPLASTTQAVTTTVTPKPTTKSRTESSPKASSSSSSAKGSKSAKAETPVVSSTPVPAKSKTVATKAVADKKAAEQRKAERRQAGMRYLIVRNLKTRASAEKAREALLRKGVATTVERNLPGQSAEAKYSLVGLTGFDPDDDRAKLDKQVKRLKALNLDPKPFTWRS